MIYILYGLLILATLILFSLSRVRIGIIINRVHEDDYIKINMSLLFGIIKFKYEIPYLDIVFNRKLRPGLKIKKRMGSKEKRGRTKTDTLFGAANLIETYKNIKETTALYGGVFHYIVSKIIIDSIKWHTEIGAGDANITAFAAGMIWFIKSSIMGFILNKKSVNNIDIDVIPNYSKGVFQVNFHCIIRIKIANIIIAGIRIGLILLKKVLFNKGSEGNERTPYTRVDENYNG